MAVLCDPSVSLLSLIASTPNQSYVADHHYTTSGGCSEAVYADSARHFGTW